MNLIRIAVGAVLFTAATANAGWAQGLIVREGDFTLTKAESPLVVSHVMVLNGGTLFLEAGAELIITGHLEDRPISIWSGSRLIASGTPDEPVIIRQSAPNTISFAERMGGMASGTMIDLNHAIWDMGVSRLVLLDYPGGDYPNASPIMIARNSVIRSAPPPAANASESNWEWFWLPESQRYSGPMIMSVRDDGVGNQLSPTRLVIEDSLLTSPTVSTLGISENHNLEVRRCVIQGPPASWPSLDGGFRFGIETVSWSSASLIKIEDSRFVGNTAAIGLFGGYHDDIRIVQLSRSDFSQVPYFLMDFGFAELSLTVEDSHVLYAHAADTTIPRTLDFRRCYSYVSPPYSNTPQSETVSDPLDEPPFRHADINGDTISSHQDLRELMLVLSGQSNPEPVHDVDNDDDITIRDAAVLRAYVDGLLLFLPPPEAP